MHKMMTWGLKYPLKASNSAFPRAALNYWFYSTLSWLRHTAKWFTAHRLQFYSRVIFVAYTDGFDRWTKSMTYLMSSPHPFLIQGDRAAKSTHPHTEHQNGSIWNACTFDQYGCFLCEDGLEMYFFFFIYLSVWHTSHVALPVFLPYKGVSFVWVRLAVLSVVTMETAVMKWWTSLFPGSCQYVPAPTQTLVPACAVKMQAGRKQGGHNTGGMERERDKEKDANQRCAAYLAEMPRQKQGKGSEQARENCVRLENSKKGRGF